MSYINGIPGRTAIIKEKEYFFFSGFAYLGMPALKDFQQLVTEGIQKYGVVFPSSRISNTRSFLYEQFEKQLSDFTHQKASASFSSGFMASQAAVTFASQDSELLCSPGIHPSLILPGIKTNKFSSSNWEQDIIKRVNTLSHHSFTIVLESINPITGRVHDFRWLQQIKRPVRILIDDSHGIGILGVKGEGVISLLPQHDHLQYLLCYSLSKAFSCEGGAISGTEKDIEGIKKLSYFTASTGMSPAYAYAWMNAQKLFLKQGQRLKNNIFYFKKKTGDLKQIQHDPQLPVFYLNSDQLYDHCLNDHILLSAFRYPTDRDPLTVRVVLNALHTQEDLDKLSECLHGFYKEGE